MTRAGGPPLRALGTVAALALVYLLGVFSVHFAPSGSAVATWWPAAGVSVGLLALNPRSWWPALTVGIVVVSAAANVTAGRPLDVAATFGVLNAVEAVLAGAVLCRGRDQEPRLANLEDFTTLVKATLLASTVLGLGVALSVLAFDDGEFVTTLVTVTASHAAALLVVVPVALALRQPAPQPRYWELTLQMATLAVVTAAVFAPGQTLPLGFLPLPLLVWCGLRLGIRATTWELLVLSCVTTLVTAAGHGPLAVSAGQSPIDPVVAGSVVQTFLFCAALMALPLATAVEQRQQLLERVLANENLFRRNFTDSVIGMLMLRRGSAGLEIIDLNDTAARILGRYGALVGGLLDDVLVSDVPFSQVTSDLLAGRLEGWSGETSLTGDPDSRIGLAISPLSGSVDEPLFSAQILDQTPEYQARTRLQAERELTRATLDSTGCIIVVCDLTGAVVRLNPAATRLTGFSSDQILGSPLWDTLAWPEHRSTFARLFLDPGFTSRPSSGESDLATADGERLRIVWSSDVVRGSDGAPTHMVLTGIDVTAERTTAGLMTHLLQSAMTTALIGMDRRGQVTVFNSGAERLLGHGREAVVTTPFVDLFDPEQLATLTRVTEASSAFNALVGGLGRGEVAAARDVVWRKSDGSHCTVSMTLSVVQDAFSHQVGYFCVARDVTEQRINQELLVAALEKERDAVERLRRLDEAKNEFVSTVSHELRTPVTSIVGYTEILQDGTVTDPHPEQMPLLAAITRNGERLIHLANDLLKLSSLEGGEVVWKRDEVDLIEIVRHGEEVLHPLLAERVLSSSFDVPGEPVLVLGDRGHLDRVLVNLLSNAVKFTPNGGSLSCRLETRGDEALLSVRDTGMGIPLSEQGALFQKFFRSAAAQEMAIPGTGLGLSIVASIVEAHSGHIDVDSRPGEGTTFTVRLPLAALPPRRR